MHGLINKALQSFLHDTFGAEAWRAIAQHSGVAQRLGSEGFESMQLYEDSLTQSVLDAATTLLRRPRDSLLEDMGNYLISNEKMDPLRRLLRFGGVSFTEFLYSLDDLQGRSHLAVPDLDLPEFTIEERGAGQFTLVCRGKVSGFGHVMVGVLRALADDYGALVVLEHQGLTVGNEEGITIDVHDPAFHAGRHFDLTADQR